MKPAVPEFSNRLTRFATTAGVILAAAIGATTLSVLGAHLEQLRLAPSQETVLGVARTLQGITVAMSLLASAAAAHMILTARRALRCGAFPPPDARWMRRAPVTGIAARRQAAIVFVLAGLLLACSFALPVLTSRLVGCLT